MLIEFSLANFKSVAEKQTFSMLPARGSSYLAETGNRHFPQVLRVGALFGANGSGKTNLLEGLSLVSSLVEQSGKNASGDTLPVVPFRLDPVLAQSPTTFELTFSYEGDVWRYGAALDAAHIHQEWLFQRARQTGRERKVFYREGGDLGLTPRFGAARSIIEETTAPNQLLLSKLDQFADSLTHPAYFWISVVLRTVLGSSLWFQSITARRISEQEFSEEISELLRAMGMGFSEIAIQESRAPEGSAEMDRLLGRAIPGYTENGVATFFDVKFKTPMRDGGSAYISFIEESLGTKALFGIVGIILDALKTGLILVIDELNQSFHPEYLRMIVELFRSPEANPLGAQLVFSAHDTSVMSILERDELWIAEKDEHGATRLFSLADIGPARQGGPRRRGAFGKQYLENKFGGLPRAELIRAIRAVRGIHEEHG